MRSTMISLMGLGLSCLLLVPSCGEPESDDTTPPSLVDAQVSGERVAAGNTLEVILEPNEELEEAPIVTLLFSTATTMTSQSSAAPYRFTYAVTGDEEEGEVLVEASLKDAAGNTSTEGVGIVNFDFTGPTVAAINFGNTQNLKQGSTGVISFVVDDALGTGAVATFTNSGDLTDAPLEYLLTAAGLPAFTYEATGDEPEGMSEITLQLTDVVGNGAASGPFEGFIFDFTLPALVGPADITSELVSIGSEDSVEVTFTVSEPLENITALMRNTDNDDTAQLTVSAGIATNEYIASRQLGAHAPFVAEFWNIEVNLTDLADNQSNELSLGLVELIP